MFQCIVFLFDGSAQAERLISLGAQMAQGAGGRFILLCMLPSSTPQEEAQARLGELLQRHHLSGREVEQRFFSGTDALALLAAIQAAQADLLILCLAGHTSLACWKPEQAIQLVVCQGRIPILVIPERARPLAPGDPVRVLAALDGSRLAEAALAPAAALAAALAAPRQGAVHLVRVISDLAQQRKAAAYLRVVARRLRQSALAKQVPVVSWSVVSHLDVAEALRWVACQGEDAEHLESWSVAREIAAPFERCEVLALTTHCRRGLERWTLGSVIEQMMRWERRALLIVPPPGSVQEGAQTAGEITEAELHAWLGISGQDEP
jgi:nucleotide-binding universal stress UspA family protein